MTQLTWWEKTVEYAFILEASHNNKVDFLAPLSGVPERMASDLMAAQDGKFVLIEFKRDKSQLGSEADIFLEGYYDLAKETFSGCRHHFLVYGKLSEDLQLVLAAQHYFSGAEAKSALSCLDAGIQKAEFDEYLTLLSCYKKQDGRSSSGHVSPSQMGTVLGLTNEGKISVAMSLEDYTQQYTLSPELSEDYPAEDSLSM